MPKRSAYQERIIRHYSQNQDSIMLQRLGELVTDLYLAEGKTREGLDEDHHQRWRSWEIAPERIEYVTKADNPELLAKLLSKSSGK